MARTFQHELDHLDGILYTSKMIPESYVHLSKLRDAEEKSEIEDIAIAAAQKRAEERDDDDGHEINLERVRDALLGIRPLDDSRG